MHTLLQLATATGLSLSLLTAAVQANEIRVGVNGGYAYADSNELTQDLYSGQVYGQYKFDNGFGVEGGYNYFGNGKVKGEGDAVMHGPYAAVSYGMNFEQNFELFGRGGAMYSISEGDIPSDKRISPFVGVGAQYNFTNNFYGRAGYDHYFNAARNDDYQADLDLIYAGLGYKF